MFWDEALVKLFQMTSVSSLGLLVDCALLFSLAMNLIQVLMWQIGTRICWATTMEHQCFTVGLTVYPMVRVKQSINLIIAILGNL